MDQAGGGSGGRGGGSVRPGLARVRFGRERALGCVPSAPRMARMPPLIDPLIDGVRVLDVCGGLAGPYAAKLLADLGADVIKVEPPQGDPARRAGPFPSARPDPEASAPFLYANTSKRGVTLDLGGGDLGAGADRDRFLGLVTTAQVVIAGESEPALAARGIGLEALRRANPRIILVTATGFGGDGPTAIMPGRI